MCGKVQPATVILWHCFSLSFKACQRNCEGSQQWCLSVHEVLKDLTVWGSEKYIKLHKTVLHFLSFEKIKSQQKMTLYEGSLSYSRFIGGVIQWNQWQKLNLCAFILYFYVDGTDSVHYILMWIIYNKLKRLSNERKVEVWL